MCRCVVCGDFTAGAAERDGKCLHCFQNPDAVIDGKPRVIHDYLQAEEVKAESQERLMLLYVDTPLSLNVDALQTALAEAKANAVGINHIRCEASALSPPPHRLALLDST